MVKQPEYFKALENLLNFYNVEIVKPEVNTYS